MTLSILNRSCRLDDIISKKIRKHVDYGNALYLQHNVLKNCTRGIQRSWESRERFSVEPSAASWNRNRSSAHKTAQQRDSLIPKSLERSKGGGGRTMTIYPCDWLPLLNLETSQLETRNNRKSKKLFGI